MAAMAQSAQRPGRCGVVGARTCPSSASSSTYSIQQQRRQQRQQQGLLRISNAAAADDGACASKRQHSWLKARDFLSSPEFGQGVAIGAAGTWIANLPGLAMQAWRRSRGSGDNGDGNGNVEARLQQLELMCGLLALGVLAAEAERRRAAEAEPAAAEPPRSYAAAPQTSADPEEAKGQQPAVLLHSYYMALALVAEEARCRNTEYQLAAALVLWAKDRAALAGARAMGAAAAQQAEDTTQESH